MKTFSRQYRWQLDRISKGLCATCGKEPIEEGNKSSCYTCRRKKAASNLAYYAKKRGGPPKFEGRKRLDNPLDVTSLKEKLGKQSDASLAKEFGVKPGTIRYYRLKFEIKRFRKHPTKMQ